MYLRGPGTLSCRRKPGVHHLCVRVAGFDRRAVTDRLTRAGVEVVRSSEDGVVSLRDPNGLVMELRG
jgi:hypothetical protein